jgi:hypothetical protein
MSVSVGLGMTRAVFAATGKEDNYNETGGGMVTTEEYGAFADSYMSGFVEINLGEVLSIGASMQGDMSTPTNVNERGGDEPVKSDATSTVQVDFEQYFNAYLKLNVPLGGTYLRAGIARVDVITNEVQASGNTYPNKELDGYIVAIGYQHETDAGVGIRAEIQGHSFDDVTVDNGAATTANFNKITISDMIGATAQLSLVKTF